MIGWMFSSSDDHITPCTKIYLFRAEYCGIVILLQLLLSFIFNWHKFFLIFFFFLLKPEHSVHLLLLPSPLSVCNPLRPHQLPACCGPPGGSRSRLPAVQPQLPGSWGHDALCDPGGAAAAVRHSHHVLPGEHPSSHSQLHPKSGEHPGAPPTGSSHKTISDHSVIA